MHRLGKDLPFLQLRSAVASPRRCCYGSAEFGDDGERRLANPARSRHGKDHNVHRQALLELLARHRTFDDREEQSLARIHDFVRSNPRCFERSLATGHVTGSGWLLDPAGTAVLLTQHRKLRKWVQLGGHADGHSDVLEVAIREAHEESGIATIGPVSDRIFDVDVHRIPAFGGVAEHDHYDVGFLLQVTGDTRFRVSEESLSLAWVPIDGFASLDVDESLQRKHQKWVRLDGRDHGGAELLAARALG